MFCFTVPGVEFIHWSLESHLLTSRHQGSCWMYDSDTQCTFIVATCAPCMGLFACIAISFMIESEWLPIKSSNGRASIYCLIYVECAQGLASGSSPNTCLFCRGVMFLVWWLLWGHIDKWLQCSWCCWLNISLLTLLPSCTHPIFLTSSLSSPCLLGYYTWLSPLAACSRYQPLHPFKTHPSHLISVVLFFFLILLTRGKVLAILSIS